MEIFTGHVSIRDILVDQNNWKRYLAWKHDTVDAWTRHVVSQTIACRTPAMGFHLFHCPDCNISRFVPHTCKTAFCSSCGKARTDQWTSQLLSDILDVTYRHLILTIPCQLRHLMRVNKNVLLSAIYRAASSALLSLTAGKPLPAPGINRDYMSARRKKFLPGFVAVCHTFGSDLKFNPHIHLIVTAGGLSLDGKRWVMAPLNSLVPVHHLAREWKKNLLKEIEGAEEAGELFHPPFNNDPNNPTDVPALLTCVRKKKWWVSIGPTLQSVDNAVKYCCRYTRRPVIGEMRLLKYDGKDVYFRYNDYYNGGQASVRRRSVLHFIDRLIQHILPKHFTSVRQYGIFAPNGRKERLARARRMLGKRKRRRPRPQTWQARRKAQGERNPLACPKCGQPMRYLGKVFGSPKQLAQIAGILAKQRLPPRWFVPGISLQGVQLRA